MLITTIISIAVFVNHNFGRRKRERNEKPKFYRCMDCEDSGYLVAPPANDDESPTRCHCLCWQGS